MQHEYKWHDYRSELSVAIGDILKQLYVSQYNSVRGYCKPYI